MWSLLFFKNIFLFLGILGMLLATFLCPALAILAYNFQKKEKNVQNEKIEKIRILIPIHNEEENLEKSIDSIQKAINKAKEKNSEITFSILAGLNNCTDNSANILKEKNIEYIEQNDRSEKWLTLKKLVQASSKHDWLIFVDAGSYWSDDLLLKLTDKIKNSNAVGIMPSYINSNASFLEKISWTLEQQLKSLENLAGGPTTSHGATVAYKEKNLSEALNLLADDSYLNDDVVIPLILRFSKKTNTTFYCTDLYVEDKSKKIDSKREFKRRLRMLRGNFEWLPIYFKYYNKVPLATYIIPLRRIFRFLWGYWIAFISLAILLSFFQYSLFLGVAVFLSSLIALCRLYRSLSGVFEAWLVSIISPYILLTKNKGEW